MRKEILITPDAPNVSVHDNKDIHTLTGRIAIDIEETVLRSDISERVDKDLDFEVANFFGERTVHQLIEEEYPWMLQDLDWTDRFMLRNMDLIALGVHFRPSDDLHVMHFNVPLISVFSADDEDMSVEIATQFTHEVEHIAQHRDPERHKQLKHDNERRDEYASLAPKLFVGIHLASSGLDYFRKDGMTRRDFFRFLGSTAFVVAASPLASFVGAASYDFIESETEKEARVAQEDPQRIAKLSKAFNLRRFEPKNLA